MPEQDELMQGFRLGDWVVLPSRGVIRRGDQEERPEPLVFGLLLELARRDGDLVTKDELVDALWDGRAIGDTPLTRAVYELRKHLDDRERPYTYVETLKRRGYRLMRKVELLDASAGAGSGDNDESPRRSSPWLRGATILLIVGFAGAVVWFNGTDSSSDCTTIEVRPFESHGSSTGRDYLSYGFREELVKTLHAEPGLCVVTTDPDAVRASILPLGERIRIDAVLSGGVQSLGDMLKVSYELIDTESGDVLLSDSVTRELSGLFDLQAAVALSVRDDLLPDSAAVLLSATRPADFDAYQAYLRGLYAFERRGSGDNFESAVRYFSGTVERDPGFGPAYIQLATATALAPVYADADPEASYAKAIDIAGRGIEADRTIEDAAGAVFGYVAHQQKNWLEAESAYRRATSAKIVDANAFSWYSRMLASVGLLDQALEAALTAWRMDPDNAVLNSRVAMTYAWLGQSDRAGEFFERAGEFGASGATHLLAHALHLSSVGDAEGAATTARRATDNAGMPQAWIDAVLAGIADPSMTDNAIAAVDGAAGYLSPQIEVVTRTLLGDLDGAMRVAWLLDAPGEAFEMDLLWIPELEPLRQHPGFVELVGKLGLVDYWATRGCSFIDARVDCSSDQGT